MDQPRRVPEVRRLTDVEKQGILLAAATLYPLTTEEDIAVATAIQLFIRMEKSVAMWEDENWQEECRKQLHHERG